ncbi:MAG TPA: 50S ribosomal protein L9 [Deltaproteobacteria bacterium]|nr:50S ribosomal protein L9 [Deltaproteobacteria bacterium]
MKVVLLENIEGVGAVGQEVKVKSGYARNYLIPRGLALMATDSSLKEFKDKIQAKIKSEATSKGHALKLAEEIEAVILSFTVKTGQEGKLFGSVTTANIHEALTEKGFEVDRKKIALPEPIRHVGTHDVSIKLYPEVSATVKVEVLSDTEA